MPLVQDGLAKECTSKARRLRGAATKRRLFEESRNLSAMSTSICKDSFKIDSLIEQVQYLTAAFHSFAYFSPQSTVCWWGAGVGGADNCKIPGTPAEILAKECDAARVIQKHFRKRMLFVPTKISQDQVFTKHELLQYAYPEGAIETPEELVSLATYPEDRINTQVERCTCRTPMIRHRCCTACGHQEAEVASLFDRDDLPALEEFSCVKCIATTFHTNNECDYYTLQSAQECSACLKVDAQELLERCCGLHCERPYHTKCMRRFCGKDDCLSFLCESCAGSGNYGTCPTCPVYEAEDVPNENESQVLAARNMTLAENADARAPSVLRCAQFCNDRRPDLESRLNGMLDIVDLVDNGHVELPVVIKSMVISKAREMYDWMQSDFDEKQVKEKIAEIDRLMNSVNKQMSKRTK